MQSELNRHFGIGESLVFVDGEGKLPKAIMRDSLGHELELYLFGATITQWRSPRGVELLYLSPDCDFSGTKPLRGGIPLVFPQFGGGPLPAHGFARTNNWTPTKSSTKPNGEVVLILELKSNEATRSIWPHEFSAELEIKLGADLTTTLRVLNTGSTEFQFQNAFHTYFKIDDLTSTFVSPLNGLTFLDSTKNRAPGSESREKVTFPGEVDRIYVDAPNTVTLRDDSRPLTFAIKKNNMADAVVWNPWIEKARNMKDLPDDGYKNFVCVETGNVAKPITLAAGSTWSCSQKLEYF